MSRATIHRQVEGLIVERAMDRLALIVWSFSATALDVDIYAYIDFPNEVLEIRKGKIVIFQYGTARIDFDDPGTKVLNNSSGSYEFSLYINLRSSMEKYLDLIRTSISVTTLIFSLLFGIFGFMLLHTAIDPIIRLATSITHITSRNLQTRLTVPSQQDEFSKLVESFNGLLDEIQGSWNRQSQFVDDMTHDIVTPVQILEGYRQLIERHGKTPELVDEYLDVSQVELGRLRRMTVSLKAKLASEKRRNVEHADASAICSRIVGYYTGLYPSIRFEKKIKPHVALPVSEEDLERMLHILLENAVKYGTDDCGKGHITLELRGRHLSVRDQGQGIRPEEKVAVFERSYRGTRTCSRQEGSGIGLAILKKFAEEYGFSIELESEPGKGAHFKLVFSPSPEPG